MFLRQIVEIITCSLTIFSPHSESASMAIDILANIAQRIDLTGRRRIQQNNFLEDLSSLPNDDKNKTILYLRLSSQFSASSSLDYIKTSHKLIHLLTYILLQYKYISRNIILKSLETLSKLSQVPENSIAINNCPISVLAIIKELIGLSYYNNNSIRQNNNNQISIKKMTTPFIESVYDYELRDNSLECLYHLSANSNNIQNKITKIPNFIELLFRMTFINHNARTEGNQRSSQILSILIAQNNNINNQINSLKTELLLSASADDNIADIICNKGNNSILIEKTTQQDNNYMEVI